MHIEVIINKFYLSCDTTLNYGDLKTKAKRRKDESEKTKRRKRKDAK